MSEKLNVQAWQIRTELWTLANRCKELAVTAADYTAKGQLDEVGSAIARLHADLPELFSDAARDPADQRFAE